METETISTIEAAPRPGLLASSMAEEQRRLETQLGQTVRIETPRWANLMQEGVIVRLHIRRWRGKTQITLTDLGLPQPRGEAEERFYNELMALGTKRLLPAELLKQLDSIDSAARKALTTKSYKTYWGEFLPVGAMDEWKQLNADYESRYLALREKIKADWQKNMRELLRAYAVVAHTAYRRLRRLNPASLKNVAERAFVEGFMTRIRQAIPTRDEVYRSFAYETEISFIPLPSLLASDQAEADKIAERRSIEREQERVERDALSAKEQALRRMNAEVVQAARAKKDELLHQFVRDLQEQSMSAIYDGMVNVLESIQRNDGAIVGRAAGQVRGVVASWKAMNLLENPDVDSQINRIDEMVNAKQRSAKDIAQLLREIATTARAQLVSLGANPRSARSVGIADRIEPLELQRARRRLESVAALEGTNEPISPDRRRR